MNETEGIERYLQAFVGQERKAQHSHTRNQYIAELRYTVSREPNTTLYTYMYTLLSKPFYIYNAKPRLKGRPRVDSNHQPFG